MSKLTTFLSGKKTYIVAVLTIVINFAVFMNWLTVDQLNTVNVILGALGFAAVRSGIKKG